MRKSNAACIVARRLNLSPGRVDALVASVSDAGLLPKAIGRHVVDLVPAELATLLLAAVADRGLGVAGHSVREFSTLQSSSGETLHSALTNLLSHSPALQGAVTGSLVLRLEPASVALTIGGEHTRYGPEPPSEAPGRHVLIPGQTLAAIGLELAGSSRDEADALVALARASRALDLSAAFSKEPT